MLSIGRKYKLIFLITLLFITSFFSQTIAAAEVVLVQDGVGKAVIVLPNPSGRSKDDREVEQEAANLLVNHIFEMTGAKLPIQYENLLGNVDVSNGEIIPDPNGIVADVYVLVGEGDLAKRLGLTSKDLGPGGIIVKVASNVVALLGPKGTSDPGGTRHAVIEFLEELGFRYLWPGQLGKVVPKGSTVAVAPFERQYTPLVGQRHTRWTNVPNGLADLVQQLMLMPDSAIVAWIEASQPESPVEWRTWHRFGGKLGITGRHAYTDWWDRYGKAHPDWFALQGNGSRSQHIAPSRAKLCTSNPEVIEAVANDVIAQATRNRSLKSISIAPNDGQTLGFCVCENCKALDALDGPKVTLTITYSKGPQDVEYVSLTDRHLAFYNAVAEKVAAVYPDLLLVADAYSRYKLPPVREKVHPNLVIRYISADLAGWDKWAEMGAEKMFWRPNVILTGWFTGLAHSIPNYLVDSMNFLAERGLMATDFDSVIHYWALHGLNYYVTAKLNWNPSLSVDEILDDYCGSGFGAGAKYIKEYFLFLEEITKDIGETTAGIDIAEDKFTVEQIKKLRSLLNEAEAAVGDDETIKDRIAFLRTGLNVTDLHITLYRMARDVQNKKKIDQNYANKLMDLRYLVMRDLVINNPLAVNVGNLLSQKAYNESLAPLKWSRSPALKLEDPKTSGHTLTGEEDSIEEMMEALGLGKKKKLESPIVTFFKRIFGK